MSTHILLIEPDAANAVIFGESIQAFMEARVTVAHSDVDAMTLMEAGVRPDVVLLVWSGGEVRGSDLVGALREILPRLPIVILLEDGTQSTPALEAIGVQGILSKPLFYPDLPGALMEAMSLAPGAGLPPAEEGITGSDVAPNLADMLDSPLGGPALGGHLELTPDQSSQLAEGLAHISSRLEKTPLLLSQDGTLLSHAGELSPDAATAMARLAGRVWREGATRSTPEWLCFSDQLASEGGERRSMALYSVVVAGDLTLCAAWDGSPSLSTLRANALEAATVLGSLVQ